MPETTMVNQRTLRRRVAGAALALVLGGMTTTMAAAAPLERSVIGSNGEVFRVIAGPYGELFPAAADVEPSFPVLALDVDESNGSAYRLLVPGTEGFEDDGSPALVYDEVSQVVHLVWEARINSIHPVLRLASYSAGAWSAPIEIIGDPFAAKTHPVLFVSHDSTRAEAADGAVQVRQRTILHLVWVQEKSTGSFDTLYSPILLGDDPSSRAPVISLDDIAGPTAPDEAPLTGMDSAEGLVHLRAGEDGRTVVVAFASGASGRIAAVRIDILPVELARLGEEARAHIIDAGFDGSTDGLRRIADGARAHIIDAGVHLNFHEEVVRSIADGARAHIIDAGAHADLEIRRIANGARAHIIDAGVKYSDRGLRRVVDSTASAPQVVDLSPPSDGASENLVRAVRTQAIRVPFSLGDSPRLLSSPSGRDFVLSWRDGERLVYRESRGGGEWSDLRMIRLSPTLTVEDAYAALERRVSSF
jgi:hypothetical protein